ncbi:ABC transporter permease [Fulvivirgaceae bacterium BMA12]|uniref:ABC transporter permease n=1 Tax=Agaribacillus aureus TaxID=3051825 RepID=A0ABT8LLD4_9BACT|nr:ABC transporter permease [Fulvivirgaceae bacterium BMA12]
MLRNYLSVAFRTLIKGKAYSVLTIFSLALGLSISVLIMLYVGDELSYDRFHKNAQRIYRINSDISFSQNWIKTAGAPTPMAVTLKADFPEIEETVRLGKYNSLLVKSDGESFWEESVLYADSTIFDVFTIPVIVGNPRTALVAPQSVVITERMAQKYFGTTDVLSRTLTFAGEDVREITAVIENIPPQSHFQADFILPLHVTDDAVTNKWTNHIFSTYLLLKPGIEPELVESKFEVVLQTYMDPALQQFFGTTLEETRKAGNGFEYTLIPLTRIHLYSDRPGELLPGGNIQYVYLFSAIAGFILLIAIFNFVNLTIARSFKRAREIGARKVLGSTRGALVAQFLSESLITTFLALGGGIMLIFLFLPVLNDLAAKQLLLSHFFNGSVALVLFLGTILVGLLAGAYPAFYLSSFKATSVVKGKIGVGIGSQHLGLRRILIIFQFSLSILLILGTLIVSGQLNYIQNKNLGFNKEQVLIVKTAESSEGEVRLFKEEALRSPWIETGTISGFLPITSRRGNDGWYPEGPTDQQYRVQMEEWRVDPEYIPTLQLELLQGRNFDRERTTDGKAAIINESAAKQLGYQQPVGKTIRKTGTEMLNIIGVVKDFNYESLRTEIAPLLLHQDNFLANSWEAVSFRLIPNDISTTLARLEQIWKGIAPEQPFAYSFLDEGFDAIYRTEQRIEKLFITFATIAILIACFGLFGLSAFTTEQRTKEIGVRKVFGASIPQLVALLLKEFLPLLLLANLLAWPVAWWVGQRWLENYVYRTSIELQIFVLVALGSGIVALATVSFQSIKAAQANPIISLRNE